MSAAPTLHPDRPDLFRPFPGGLGVLPPFMAAGNFVTVQSVSQSLSLTRRALGDAAGYPVSGDLLALIRAGVRTVGPVDQ